MKVTHGQGVLGVVGELLRIAASSYHSRISTAALAGIALLEFRWKNARA